MSVENVKNLRVLKCVARFGLEIGQISPKSEKSGTFLDQISVHFGSASQNVLKSDLKKFQIFPISDQFDPLWTYKKRT